MKKFFLKFIFFIFLVIVGTYVYATNISINSVNINEYKIKIKDLTNNFNGFKIVHISDIFYGTNFNEKQLSNLVNKINKANPDIVVLSGDLINKNNKITTSEVDKISELLSKIKTTCGKYAIKGDNDLKFDEWQNIIKNSGFIDLDNSYDTIYKKGYNYLLIAGVSTFKDKENINNKLTNTLEYINSLEKNGPIYKILVMHEPDYIDDLKPNPFNLVLAGHVNNQVNLPNYGPLYKRDGTKKYYNNHYKLENSDLYISSGLGCENYKFRLKAPSFNVYRLVK